MTITNPRDLPKIDEFIGDECFAEALRRGYADDQNRAGGHR